MAAARDCDGVGVGRTPGRQPASDPDLDSERCDHVTLRPGDVVISTSMKAGTTWMQRIMSLLVFGPGPLPAPLVALSPWIDAAFLDDVESVVATIEAQEHQRFLKSHLPFDAVRGRPDAAVPGH